MTVRALARPDSDTDLLRDLGADIVPGDLTQPDRLAEAVRGAHHVFHCAAKVGDWGPVEDYRRVNVEGTRALLEACRGADLRCFVHLSSLGVYAARHHHGTDESEPLPDRHIDGYTQSKVESERLALSYHQQHRLPVVVLRPGFIYGPRDRTVLPQLIDNLRRRRVRWLGGGRGLMNTIYVGNLVDALFLPLEKEQARGQVYNLTDGERVTKRQFLEALADGAGVPRPPWLGVPLWLARVLAHAMEKRARARGDAQPPRLTMARLKFLGLNLDFSIEKAKRELGYQPRFSFARGMAATVAWLAANGLAAVPAGTDVAPG
jgi:nucleoside-diphosphate-sugar epimerase